MGIYYDSRAMLYAPFTKETIYSILKKCDDKNYSFYSGYGFGDSRKLSVDEAVDYVFNGIDEDPTFHVVTVQFKKGRTEHLYFYQQNGATEVYFTARARRYILDGCREKDSVMPSSILLNITSDFILQNFFITNDTDDLFENPIEPDMFYVRVHRTYRKEVNFFKRDAFYIMQQLQNIGCSFINDEQQPIDEEAIIDTISKHLSTKENLIDPILIKTENGSLIQAYFYDYIFKFLPLQPWTMKEVDSKQGIDIAYYSKILLAMAEPFGIYELATHCNNAFYE